MSNEKPVELTVLRRIISDPGAVVPRGNDFTEPIPQWSARAVLASGWVSPEEAKAREAVARREALLEAARDFTSRANQAHRDDLHVVSDAWDMAASDLRALAEPERDEEGGR